MNDHVRAGQVEPRASGLERKQENAAFPGVEAVAQPYALVRGRVAVQIQALYAFLAQTGFDQAEHAGELAEYQRAPPVL